MTQSNANKKRRVHVTIPKGKDSFDSLPELSRSITNIGSLEFDEFDMITIDLDDSEVEHVKEFVAKQGGLFSEDESFSLPPFTYMTIEEYELMVAGTTPSQNPIPTFITSIPKYDGTLRGQDVAIMDSEIYPEVLTAKGYKVQVLDNLFEGGPCLAHGTNVAEVIAQMYDPTKTDLKFLNFPVFDCNGQASIGMIAHAAHAIIKYKRTVGRHRGLVVNFSGNTTDNSIVNSIFRSLLKAKITVFNSAGNYYRPCEGYSPANMASKTTLISVGAIQGQDLAGYSNYSVNPPRCVSLYLPGCLPMTDPIDGSAKIGCGTSFASPMAAGFGMFYQQHYRKVHKVNALPQAVKKALRGNTVAKESYGIQVNSITPQMAFIWGRKKAIPAVKTTELAGDSVKNTTLSCK